MPHDPTPADLKNAIEMLEVNPDALDSISSVLASELAASPTWFSVDPPQSSVMSLMYLIYLVSGQGTQLIESLSRVPISHSHR